MKRIILTLALSLVAIQAHAQRIVTKGTTDETVELLIVDDTTGQPETGVVFNTAGIDLWYQRPGAAKTSITEVTLAALTTAHTDGGFLTIGNGVYRLDVPDAAFATGVSHVTVGGTVTGMIVRPVTVQLVAFDLQTALQSVNATQFSGDSTAADNAEAFFDGAGYAGGTIKLGVDSVAFSGDTTAADNAELMFDGTGYAGGTAKLGINVTQWLGTAAATPTVAGVPEVDITHVGGSAASPAAGAIEAYLSDAERQKLTGYSTVVHVPHTGNDTTSGTNLKAAVLAAASGTLVKADPGAYIITAPLTLPAGVKLLGAGRTQTTLSFANGVSASPDVIPGTNSTLESVRIIESVDGFPISTGAAATITGALIKDVDVISGNLECVVMQSSNPCSMTLEDVYLESVSEWGIDLQNDAHRIDLRNVTVMVTGNGSTTDFKGFGLNNGSTLIGDRVKLLTNEFSVGGQALRLAGASQAFLTNSSIFNADININDAGSYLLMVNCDFDRSQVTGFPARLVDVSDPSLIWDDPKSQHAIADTFGDYLDDEVSAGGGGGLDAAGVRAAIGLATANLDTQLADVPTVAELNARTLIAANYFDPAADAVATVTNLTNLPTIPANWLTAAGINANAFTAAKFDADVTTEIQIGLATAANLDIVDNFLDTEIAAILAAVDTEIAAILADTNELQTDWANGGRLDVILDAAGSAGDPWVTTVPGAYPPGSAGFIMGTNLNATVSSIKTKTDFLPSATAGAAGGVFIAGVNADTTVNIIGNLSGNVGGSCASVIGNVGGQVGAVTGNVGGNVTGSVGSISGVTFPTNFPTLGINASGHVSRVTVTDTVTSGSGLDAAGTRAALGLATANLDTQLTDIPTNAELTTALDPLPTATENATQLLATTITDTGVNTVGRFVSWLNATLDSSGVFDAPSLVNTPLADMTQEQIDDIADAIVAAGATLLTDVDQEPVAPSRTWLLEPTGAQGLRGDAKSIAVGQEETFAFDFRKDMSVNDRIITVGTPVLVGTPSSGITFGTTGRDKSQGKVRITPTTAGTYTIRLSVVANSGGNKTGTVILKVSP